MKYDEFTEREVENMRADVFPFFVAYSKIIFS